MSIGFIGLGAMGARIALRLQRKGHHLVISSRRIESAEALLAGGAVWRETPAEIAAACDVVFLALPDPEAICDVATGDRGLLAGARPGGAVFDLSTNAPALARQLGMRFGACSAHFLDAPVSGGPKGAADGRLALWVGGDEGAFNRHRSMLDAIADRVSYLGPSGAGAATKLVHNLSHYALNHILAEAFSLGVGSGIDPLTLFRALRDGTLGRRRTFDGLADQFLSGNFDPAKFTLRLATKDVRLAADLGRELNIPTQMADLTLSGMNEALDRGWGERDSRSAMLLQLERAGLGIAIDRAHLDALLADTTPPHKGEENG